MGLESAPQRGITIQPRDLIAAADSSIVTPTAVEALTDAFRKGSVTVAEITQRGQQIQKNKIDLDNAAREQAFNNDPQIVEARKSAAIAHGSIARAKQAQAESSLRLQPLAEELERTSNVVAIFDNKTLGDKSFKEGFALAGLTLPTNPDGTIDVEAARPIAQAYREYDAEVARLGALTAQRSTREEKMTRADGSSTTAIVAVNALGNPISDADREAVQKLQTGKFTGFLAKRGLVQQKTEVPAADQTAFQDSPPASKTVIGPAQDFSDLIQPRAAAALPAAGQVAVAPALGQTVNGRTITSVTEAPAIPSKDPTAEKQRALLTLPRFAEANTALLDLQQKNYDPTTWRSWVDSWMPEILKSGDRKEYETAMSAWTQGYLRLESGAAISPKEQYWYEKAFFPTPGDTVAVVAQKQRLRTAAEGMVGEIASSGHLPESLKSRALQLRAAAEANTPDSSPTAPGQPAKNLTTTTGKKIGKSPTGQLYKIP